MDLSSTIDWKILGLVTTWFAWKWRNAVVFDLQDENGDAPLRVILNFVRDVELANKTRSDLRLHGRKSEEAFGWKYPDHGWVKINSDGASDIVSKVVAAGGVLRDHLGNWIRGYVHNIGLCSAVLAELWGAKDGLEMAWQLGYKRVLVAMDALELVNLLQRTSGQHIPPGVEVLVIDINAICQRDWEVKFSHTLREGNRCADWLAKYAFKFSIGLHQLDEPPQLLQPLLLSDVIGLRWPRDD